MEVRPGYKQTEVGVIPEEWDVKRFDELFAFRNGVNADKEAYGRGIRFINVLEPITYSHLLGSEAPGRVTLPATVAASYTVCRGDVLFNRTSETDEEVGMAATFLGTEAVVFGGFVIRGRPKGQSLDPLYSGYALRAPAIRSQIVPMGQGTIRSNISQQNLGLVWAPIPPQAEQEAIAATLRDADALVELLGRLIAKKCDLKQAAMQQLLTGRFRLPGFGDDWYPSTVGEQFEIRLGKMLDVEKNVGVRKPYLGNRAVQWNRIDLSDLPTMAMSASDLDRFRLRRGDLLVCEGGEVGRAAIWEAPVEECYYQKALHRLRPVRNLNPRLMLALLHHWVDVGYLTNYVTKTSIAHLTREKFGEVPVSVPPAAEQAAIVDLLMDMDVEIAALEQRRQKSRHLKQAMVQELLTGRTRLV